MSEESSSHLRLGTTGGVGSRGFMSWYGRTGFGGNIHFNADLAELVLTNEVLESSLSSNVGIFQPEAGEYILFL
jgi:hypothetical protein